ncbi:MAG: T9SS type B sorting domain-containing protein, partial [Flavobacteriales bacterium]|nr:T9SS type B sorting domain-containing protein [Flavobacteriales bacterium]
YQDTQDGSRATISGDYRLRGNTLSYRIGTYDASQELIIDPTLIFSSYSGSTANNFGYTATFDQAGFLYSGSSVFANGYPTSMGAYDMSFNDGNVDIAISKFDTTGTFLVYSTYLGGSADELPHSIIVNELDELYVFGTTGSDNYPVTSEAFDQQFAGADFSLGGIGGLGVDYLSGSDLIVSKLSFDGTELLASSYIGENGMDGLNIQSATKYNYADEIRGEIELDDEGNVIIASCTGRFNGEISFPTTDGAPFESFIGGDQDGVLFSMDPDLEQLLWSTFIGGEGEDAALSIAIRSDSLLVICGGTDSEELPSTPAALFNSYQGGSADAWVMVYDPLADSILHMSYWGTSSRDQAYMVELDSQDNVHLFGQTANGDALIINADHFDLNSGQFITKMSPEFDGLIWSTAFGNGNGQPNISPTAFLVDVCDRIYLSGWGGPTGPNNLTVTGLEVTDDAFQDETSSGDFYLMALADDASELLYGSFYGGDQSNEHVDGGTSRFDKKGKVYQAVCAGCQGNSDFPIFPTDAHSAENGSTGCNLGVFKMDFDLPLVIADFIYEPICLPDSVTFLNTSEGGLDFQWDFGDGNSSNDYQPTHLYDTPGLYTVSLTVSDPMSCNLIDSIQKEIFIFDSNGVQLSDTTICAGESVQIGFDPLPIPGLSYSWTQGEFLSEDDVADPIATVAESTLFTLVIDNGVCPSSATQWVQINDLGLELSPDTIICDDSSVILTATSTEDDVSYVWSTLPSFLDTLSATDSLTLTPLFTDIYYVAAEGPCRAEDAVVVSIFSEFIQVSPDTFICAGEPVNLQLSNQSSIEGLDILWTPESTILEGQGTEEVTVSVSEDQWIGVLVESPAGCQVEDSVFVEVSDLSFLQAEAWAEPDLIPLGESSQLSSEPIGPYDYQWTPPTGLSSSSIADPFASPDQTTTYTITISDEQSNGRCQRSDTVTVKVFEFLCSFPTTFVPNAFSPNADGNNDVLFVRGKYIQELNLKIYDRWGEMVFETQDPNVGWDGTFRGKELEPAVYVYHLDFICIDGQENFEKGNITLIR